MKALWVEVDRGEFKCIAPNGTAYLTWQDLKRKDWYAEHLTSTGWKKVNPKRLVYRSMEDAQKDCKRHYIMNGGKK